MIQQIQGLLERPSYVIFEIIGLFWFYSFQNKIFSAFLSSFVCELRYTTKIPCNLVLDEILKYDSIFMF